MTNNVLITGANRGIGLAMAKQYSERGDKIYGLCRKASDELSDLPGVTIIDGIDVTSDNDIMQLVDFLYNTRLDILINNAGILADEILGEINYPSIERQYAINAMGPLRVTEALLENLSAGSKVALVTSRMGSIEDNTSGGRYGYRMSKAALNAAGKSLSHDLKSSGIAVALLHPGYVQTEMTGYSGLIGPDEAASGLIERIDQLTLENSGSFWHSNGELLPW